MISETTGRRVTITVTLRLGAEFGEELTDRWTGKTYIPERAQIKYDRSGDFRVRTSYDVTGRQRRGDGTLGKVTKEFSSVLIGDADPTGRVRDAMDKLIEQHMPEELS